MKKFMFIYIVCLWVFPKCIYAELNDGLVAHYEFENNTIDSSGNGITGNIAGNIEFVAGKFGMAANFDGVNDYIEVNTQNKSLFRFIDQSVSISTWVQIFTNDNSYHFILFIGNDDITGVPRISIQKNRSGYFSGRIYAQLCDKNINSTFAHSDLEGYELPKDEWIHIACVITRNKSIKLYINGQLQNVIGEYVKYDLSSIENFVVRIGAGFTIENFDMQPHKGLIDDLRIYNRVLSPCEVKTLYNINNDVSICKYNDSDSDGIIDLCDECPNTPKNSVVYSDGCKYSNDKKIALQEIIENLKIISGISGVISD